MGTGSGTLGKRLASGVRTARFLRARLRFATRPDDLFISSYPRSGTTWLQQILVVLAHDGDPGGTHISQHAPWFERNLALGTRRVGDFDALPAPRIFKSHLPLAWLPRGGRYVYALRDGRDVAVSYYHLYRSHLGFTGDFEAFLPLFLAGRLQYGSWFKHVAGWQQVAARPDVHLLRYEALQRDLAGEMRALSRFCGFGHDDARIATLAEQCSFAYMKARQDHFDHATETPHQGGMARGQFVRSGRSGGFTDYFDDAAIARFEREAACRKYLPQLELDLPSFLH